MIRIGERAIGRGRPTFIVAEVGINHNGDLDLARRAIEAAAEAGADSVKFQNYRTEDFILDRTLTYTYETAAGPITESQYEMFKRCELDRAALLELKEHCDRVGVVFHSTPTGLEGIDDLVAADAPLLKNGSDFLVHIPLVRAMARTGLPTVLSTGMATLAEIDEAVRAYRDAGGRNLLLLHCTSSYPTPDADVHLRKIPALAEAFGVPVGFSDHSWGVTAAIGAVTLGACWIEKHFTIDRGLPGPDHRFSSDPAEFAELVTAVRAVERQLGASAIGPTESERQGRSAFRLSCVAAVDLASGATMGAADIAYRRPGTGLPPAAADWLVGRVVSRPLPAGHVFTPEDFA